MFARESRIRGARFVRAHVLPPRPSGRRPRRRSPHSRRSQNDSTPPGMERSPKFARHERLKRADCVEKLQFSLRSQFARPLRGPEKFWLGARPASPRCQPVGFLALLHTHSMPGQATASTKPFLHEWSTSRPRAAVASIVDASMPQGSQGGVLTTCVWSARAEANPWLTSCAIRLTEAEQPPPEQGSDQHRVHHEREAVSKP